MLCTKEIKHTTGSYSSKGWPIHNEQNKVIFILYHVVASKGEELTSHSAKNASLHVATVAREKGVTILTFNLTT